MTHTNPTTAGALAMLALPLSGPQPSPLTLPEIFGLLIVGGIALIVAAVALVVIATRNNPYVPPPAAQADQRERDEYLKHG